MPKTKLKVKLRWHNPSESWVLLNDKYAIQIKTNGGEYDPPFQGYDLNDVFKELIGIEMRKREEARRLEEQDYE